MNKESTSSHYYYFIINYFDKLYIKKKIKPLGIIKIY